MTGTGSSRGRSLFDFETHRNQEWLRRRKMRLEQVRQQSNEIAKSLRQKVIEHQKARLDQYDRLSEAQFETWKAEKLDELGQKLINALKEFGESYKLAEAEPDPEELIEKKCKVNLEKALKRGEIAKREELKRKKIAEEIKMATIERKKLIRKKEDLRSALVLSVPLRKQLMDLQNIEKNGCPEKVELSPVKKKVVSKGYTVADSQKKVSTNKERKKKVTHQKSCMCKYKTNDMAKRCTYQNGETIWINLNEIQNSCAGDSGVHPRSSKSRGSIVKGQKDKPEGLVEFYDFSSRYYCKSFKEFPHLVERIHPESEEPDANDLAKIEDERAKAEAKRKVEAHAVSQERGMEALRREKISQNYCSLLLKLEELQRKEKILKAQQRTPSHLHMNDERLFEKLKTRQRLMDSKFESICYEALSRVPRAEPPPEKFLKGKGGGDSLENDDEVSIRLSLSPAPSEGNTPLTSDGELTARPETTPEPRKRKKKRQLLIDIDKALREGRELRRAISRSRGSTSAEGEEGGGEEEEEEEEEEEKEEKEEKEKKEKSGSGLKEVRLGDVEGSSQGREWKIGRRSQESQTEELERVEVGVGEGEGESKILRKTGDDSLPVSTSTSYKSPPSVIRSCRMREFLEYLGINGAEENGIRRGNPTLGKEIDGLLQDLLLKKDLKSEKEEEEEEEKTYSSPTLKYYIEKLLTLSREYIAELSVSSENISTPTATDLDLKESKVSSGAGDFRGVFSRGEDLIRKSRLERADHLEESIETWKRVLEKDSGEGSEPEDVPDCPRSELAGDGRTGGPDLGPKMSWKYEEISKKCSERISELSNMLDKVRKDKEKLLNSASGESSLSFNRGGGDEDEECPSPPERLPSRENLRTSVVEGFLNSYHSPTPRKETMSTIAVADSQSLKDIEESLESWPDVMDELLKRKILSSPFKWSDGEFSSEFTTVSDNQTKPSSLETVIGNFRREMSKIKPFALSGRPSDSFSRSGSLGRPRSVGPKHQPSPPDSPKKAGGSSIWPSPTDGGRGFQEESSVDSINHALTTLGLNWAKSFLRKNEESKAMSTSSDSDEKSSGQEIDVDYS